MRGPGACPGWGGLDLASDAMPTRSHPHQDKHKAPTLPHVRPLSLQDATPRLHSPIRSSQFIRRRGSTFHYPFRSSQFISLFYHNIIDTSMI